MRAAINGLAGVHAAPRSTGAASPQGAFKQALERAAARLDAAPSVARSLEPSGRGQTLDPRRILALQTSIYRHTEHVEIASRLADHAVGAVKTLLQTRV